MRQKAFGPDKLHGAPVADLPPIAQRWKRLHARLRDLRHKMRSHPATHPSWRRWYDTAEELLKQRPLLIPEMRAAGFRVHNNPGGTPTESFRAIRQQQILESQEREYKRSHGDLQGWEVFSAGIDLNNIPPVKQHEPVSTSSLDDEIATTFLSSIHATSSQLQT